MLNRFLGQSLSRAIRLYQLSLGTVLGKQCRFYPSCSEYARQSLVRYGALKGLLRSVWRLLRCNPFNPGGYDPA